MSRSIPDAIRSFAEMAEALQKIGQERTRLEQQIAKLDKEANSIINDGGFAPKSGSRSAKGRKKKKRGQAKIKPRQDIQKLLPKDLTIQNGEPLGDLLMRISKAIDKPMTSIEFAWCAEQAGYVSKSNFFKDVARQMISMLCSNHKMRKTTRGRSRPAMWTHYR